jgi:hypothetical protein
LIFQSAGSQLPDWGINRADPNSLFSIVSLSERRNKRRI